MKKSKKMLRTLTALLLPPIITLAVVMLVFRMGGLYPFGTKSLSWCDMSQQVIPLLNQFKDILDGKSGFFLSFKNSGGMNFYGVFFFFLASPFTFLVKFVDKADMLTFANLLVAMKMCVCAFTAACFFRICRKRLDLPCTVLLSVMYPLCGYVMMYYQNVIWLDMMYLFPLLLIALDRIVRRRSPVMYTLVLTVMVAVNYYISYMIVIFILLFTAVYTISRLKEKRTAKICRDLFVGSAVAALLSAVVWLPSLIEYMQSGRGENSVFSSLAYSSFSTSYQTVLPMLFGTAFAFVTILADMISGRKRSPRNNRMLILLGLTLIPFLIEPINKMWHTGNYMSFPARFGFITIFISLVCTSYVLEKPAPKIGSPIKCMFGGVCAAAAVSLCGFFAIVTFETNEDSICKYSETLWGDDTSFKLLLGIFFAMAVGYSVLYGVYRFGCCGKRIFAVMTAVLFAAQCYTDMNIYMVHPSEYVEDSNTAQSQVYDLADQISDSDFYRVKSYAKVYNNNMIGALGYNSISHYTSLNNDDYMSTMKRLGYSGVWMETGSVGGTRLTDALLSIKYEINGGTTDSDEIYRSSAGSIYSLPDSLPMGLLLDKDSLKDRENIPESLTRTEVQEYISESIFGENIVTAYSPEDEIETEDGSFVIDAGTIINYTLDVSGSQTLYLDCYDTHTISLSEPIFDSLSVTVNGIKITDDYPKKTNNGVLYLGDFANEQVTVKIWCQKSIICRSFGIFGIDIDRLSSLCSSAEGANLTETANGLSGSCKLSESRTCMVSLPYSGNYTVKVNGKKVSYSRTLSDFISFDLSAGENEISISYIPDGFVMGLIISVIGVAAFAAYIYIRRKIRLSRDRSTKYRCEKFGIAAKYIMLTVALAASAAVYIFPVIVNILYTGVA